MTNIRIKNCVLCGNEFRYQIGKGNDKKYCSVECREKKHKILSVIRLDKLKKCKIDGCGNKATRVSYGLCETHYYRMRRTGTTDKKGFGFKYITNTGYVTIYKPEHPLAWKQGRVFEHRVVLYDHYGPGEQECFWCGKKLLWVDVIGDHLNENKQENVISNLVISCNDCNRARGAIIPFIRKMKVASLDKFIDIIRELRK